MAAQPPLALPMGELSSERETERAFAVASLGIGVVIATWYPLSHVILCICNCVHPLSHGLRRASSPKGGAKGRAMPARRTEISAQ